MSVMTAADLIQTTRELSGALDIEVVQDGYPAGAADSFFPIPAALARPTLRILPILNRKIKELARDTHFTRCLFAIGLVEDQQMYLLMRQAHDIHEIYQRNASTGICTPLAITSPSEMESVLWGTYRTTRADFPMGAWFHGTREMGVYPIPRSSYDSDASTGYQILFKATVIPADMTLATDIPAAIYDDTGTLTVANPFDSSAESALPEGSMLVPCYGAALEIARHLGRKDLIEDLQAQWMEGVRDLRRLVENRVRTRGGRLSIRTDKRQWADYRELFLGGR